MNGLNYKKIISISLVTIILAFSLPVFAQEAAPGTIVPQAQSVTEDEGAFATPGETLTTPTTGPAPSGPTTGPATSGNSVSGAVEKAYAACSGWFSCRILYVIAWIVLLVLMAVSAFFALFGNIFDLVTAVTLNPATYNLPAIYQGWTIARDSANLFFIFILLTIAIATILQIETYGAKQLLPKLIIAALFINFSFLLTQYVIFSANLMTGFFLPGAGVKGGPSSQLSVMFLAGINPNAMYKGTQFNLGAITDTQKKLGEARTRYRNLGFEKELGLEEGDTVSFSPQDPDPELLRAQQDVAQLQTQLETQQKELPNTLTQLIVAMLGVIAFILVATFALAFAGISLLIRVVILWFIMILSPVAFLFWVVPGLSSHASKWWNKLIEQAFFPVAFFFLFGLTVNMISTPQARGLFESAEKIAQQAGAGAVNTALIVSFTSVAYYTLLIIMLIASVLVAKSMGGVAAEWAEKGAKYARGAVLGYARVTTGRGVGRIAERFGTEETKGTIMRGLSHVPLVGGMMGGAAVRALEGAKKLGGLEDVRKRQAETLKQLAPADRAVYAAGLTVPARENLLNSMSETEVAQMLTSDAVSQKHKDSINTVVPRLSRDKQENIRLEQFNRTPTNLRTEFFNGLNENTQRSFVKDGKLSSRSVAELYQSNIGNIRQNINSHLDSATEEMREKFAKEYSGLFDRIVDDAEKVTSFDSLSESQKKAFLNTADEKQLGRLADTFNRSGRGEEFVSQTNTVASNRVSDVLKVLPQYARTVGKTITSVVPKIDFKNVSESIADDAATMSTVVMGATAQQVKEIVKRGGKMGEAYETQLRNMIDRMFNGDTDMFLNALERVGNSALANAIRRDRNLQRMLNIRP